MLTLNQQSIGTIIKQAYNPLFRQQLSDNLVLAITNLNLPLSASEKTDLITRLQTFINSHTAISIEDVLNPDASPSGFWSG